MANEKWQQAREIFEAALRHKPDERERFLDEICADDSALRKEVESLLVADRQAAIGLIAPPSAETKPISAFPQFETKPIHETPQPETQTKRADLYCPKCGASNSMEVKYCRACGENLKALAQAMKKTFPVMLASKFDEIVESKHEHFRRNSVFNFLFGITFAAFALTVLVEWSNWFGAAFLFVVACFSFGAGIWDMLAYKRSLALSSTSTKSAFSLETIYCPRCAEPNKFDAQFCRKCGEDMTAVVRALTQRLPTVITNLLDRYIAWAYRWILQPGKVRASVVLYLSSGILLLLIGIYFTFSKALSVIGLIYFILGLSFLIMGVWNVLTYKRNLSSDANAKELPQPSDTGKLLSTEASLETASLGATEAATRSLEMTGVSQKKEGEPK